MIQRINVLRREPNDPRTVQRLEIISVVRRWPLDAFQSTRAKIPLKMNLGEAYLDHYTHYLQAFDPAFIERFTYDGSAVQVLDFANAMQDTHILASLGLTHYQDLLGEVVEVIVPVSELDGVVINAVVASFSFLLNLRVPLREVTYLRHLHRSVPAFFERYEKSALVFSDPYPFPPGFADFQLMNAHSGGKVRMGFFVTDAEVKLVEQEGFDALATQFEKQEVDVIDLRRPSVV